MMGGKIENRFRSGYHQGVQSEFGKHNLRTYIHTLLHISSKVYTWKKKEYYLLIDFLTKLETCFNKVANTMDADDEVIVGVLL